MEERPPQYGLSPSPKVTERVLSYRSESSKVTGASKSPLKSQEESIIRGPFVLDKGTDQYGRTPPT